MAYYNTCPNCGSNLDPGEQCNCEDFNERSQIGTDDICKDQDKFLQYIHEVMTNDPPAFISALALAHIMRNQTPDPIYAAHYPRAIFEEALRITEEAAARDDTENADNYRAVAEFIRTYWLGQAPDAA